jgi:UDP-hydrolysing UDP-N-acetyl-D-glucosamine 2-epimerase
MGENPSIVHVIGAPGLDNLQRTDLPDRAELERTIGIKLTPPVVLTTLHPATLGGDPLAEATALSEAMDLVDATYVITLPNTDPGNQEVRRILGKAAERPRRAAAEAMGDRIYWGLMKVAGAMLGNSSSALIEAPAVGLPAVNIGARQAGRLRGANVLDVSANAVPIANALRMALTPEFRSAIRRSHSPYGNGHSAERIIEILRSWTPPDPPIKRWVGTA